MDDHQRHPATNDDRRLIRIGEVMHKTALPRSSLNEKIAAGTFPKPVKLGVRAVAWWEHEVNEWLDHLPRADSAGPAA